MKSEMNIEFLSWCSKWFGLDSDEGYLLEAVNDLPVIRELQSRLDSLEKDSERYNKLVSSGAFAPANFGSSPWGLASGWTKATKSELDKAVDIWGG